MIDPRRTALHSGIDEALDPVALETLIGWIFSHTPAGPVSDAEARATKNAFRNNSDYRRAAIQRFSQDFLKLIPHR